MVGGNGRCAQHGGGLLLESGFGQCLRVRGAVEGIAAASESEAEVGKGFLQAAGPLERVTQRQVRECIVRVELDSFAEVREGVAVAAIEV